MATDITLFDDIAPQDRMLELRNRFSDAVDEFVAGELEVRAAARRRNRALSLMRDTRFRMQQIAAQHGLRVPPTKFGKLLDELDDDDR
jgi:hypothetical protein